MNRDELLNKQLEEWYDTDHAKAERLARFQIDKAKRLPSWQYWVVAIIGIAGSVAGIIWLLKVQP
jgi:hypothetical protein